MTPSGVSKGRMTPEMLVKVDLEGRILEGERHPSSEAKLHLTVYRHRPDVGAVVHAHPPVSTAFAVCRRGLDVPYLAELVVGLGGAVPVAPYATLSTDEVPRSIEPYVAEHDAVLLANHGAAAWGSDLWAAFAQLWALKESRAKYTGAGLTSPIAEIRVPLPAPGVLTLDGLHFRVYSGPGWRAAACGESPPPDTILWRDLQAPRFP